MYTDADLRHPSNRSQSLGTQDDIMRAIKGLKDVIPGTVVMLIWERTRSDDPSDKHCG